MKGYERLLERDRLARLMGIELLDVAPGRAKARMVIRDDHQNGVDVVHGGAYFTLADFAFAAASNAYGTVALAINASISFLKAVREGTLTAEAEEISRSRRLATYAVRVTDDDGNAVAFFQGTVYRKDERIALEDKP